MKQLNIIRVSIRIDYHLNGQLPYHLNGQLPYHLNGQLPSSLLTLKCTMPHGTMKYITHS